MRHADKGESKLTIDREMYALLMGSNQIVHNRGRALAYMGNAEKKRLLPDGSLPGPKTKRKKHQYELESKLRSNASYFE